LVGCGDEGDDLHLCVALPWFRVEFRQYNISVPQSIDRFQSLAFDPSHSVGSDPWKWNGKKNLMDGKGSCSDRAISFVK
jgi:hypothetical protein